MFTINLGTNMLMTIVPKIAGETDTNAKIVTVIDISVNALSNIQNSLSLNLFATLSKALIVAIFALM